VPRPDDSQWESSGFIIQVVASLAACRLLRASCVVRPASRSVAHLAQPGASGMIDVIHPTLTKLPVA
jgi:hypothetical protein